MCMSLYFQDNVTDISQSEGEVLQPQPLRPVYPDRPPALPSHPPALGVDLSLGEIPHSMLAAGQPTTAQGRGTGGMPMGGFPAVSQGTSGLVLSREGQRSGGKCGVNNSLSEWILDLGPGMCAMELIFDRKEIEDY